MAVADDPLKLSYKTLIDSFERYHTGEDGHNLPDFASQLTKLKPEQDRKPQPSKEAKVPKAARVSSSRGQQQSLEAGEPPRMRVATKQAKHDEEEVAERGPVPPPFGGMPATAPVEPDILPQEPDEPCNPEQYVEWMQYYRGCAEYFQQCEENCAAEAGLDRPASRRTSRPLEQTARPADPEVPAAFTACAAGSTGTGLPRTARPSVAAPGRHCAEPETPAVGSGGGGLLGGHGGSFPPEMSRLLEGLAGTGCSASPPTLHQALQALQQQQQQQQQLRQLQQLQQLQQLLQLQQLQQVTGGLGSLGGGLGGLGALGSLGLGGNLGGLGALGGNTPWPGLSLPGAAPDLGAGSELSQESLANLLMAWYYSGYHTGLYAGRQSK